MSAQSNFEKAEKLFQEEKYEQARTIFESLYISNPTDLKTIEYLGDIAGQSKNWDKALVYYRKLKDFKPSHANYHYKYGGALGMKAKDSNKFKALGMIDEVKASFEKAITLNPKHIEARWALIELYIDEYFKRYEAAEKQYKKAVALTGSKASYYKLANLYKNKMREPEKAKSIMDSYNDKKNQGR